MNSSFFNKPGLVKNFSRKSDADIYIHNVGYHDFDYIKPITWLHTQHGYTLHYVLSGCGILRLNGKLYNIKEKQLFFIPPGQEQVYYPTPENKWKYIWIYFSGNCASQLFEDMGFSLQNPVKSPKDHKLIERTLLNLIEGVNAGKTNEHLAKSALYAVAGILSPDSSGESTAKGCAFDAAEFLDSNFAQSNLSIKDLCELLYVSHSSLCKEFKREYGCTPLSYLIQLRMAHAAKLLAESALAIKEIAALSGYRDEIHFIKTFKGYYGMTASQYRQNMQKKNGRRD